MEESNLKSLVADYDSSSSEDENCSELIPPKKEEIRLTSALDVLHKRTDVNSASVFTNPYREAENYEQSILEKHVKMTVIKEVEDKRRVCYKFRRGKCRFGDKCQYLHHNPHQSFEKETNHSDNEDIAETSQHEQKSKKRSGIKDDLVPPKRFMKTFHKYK